MLSIRPTHAQDEDGEPSLELYLNPETLKKTGILARFLKRPDNNTSASRIRVTSCTIESPKNLPILVAGVKLTSTPTQFSMHERSLKLIVGKDSTLLS